MNISFPIAIEGLDEETFFRLPSDLQRRLREFSSGAGDLSRERLSLEIKRLDDRFEAEAVVVLKIELLRPKEDPVCPSKRIYLENPDAEPILQCRDDTAYGVFGKLTSE